MESTELSCPVEEPSILQNSELPDLSTFKIQQKLYLEDQFSHDDGSNDLSPCRRLGMFLIQERKIPKDILSTLQEKGIEIDDKQGLELHIPPQNVDWGVVGNSFQRLREYIIANKDSLPKYIYGISYLASLSKRWGFTVIPLPKKIQERTSSANLLKSYADPTNGSQKQKIAKRFTVEDISLCFISVEDFLSIKK